jgi:hypothetical protein
MIYVCVSKAVKQGWVKPAQRHGWPYTQYLLMEKIEEDAG